MKIGTRIALSAAVVCAGMLSATAADEHNHKRIDAPKGGRLLEMTETHAELVVEKDRSVTIYFYNHDWKPVAVEGQVVTLLVDATGGKTKVEFEKKGETLASKTKIPDGEGLPVVVQVRQTAEAKPQNIRFTLELGECGECKRAEYACTCEH